MSTAEKLVLGAADYAIFAATLVVSSAIGIYFQVSSRQASNDDYLLGGRDMSPVPVAFSILATFMSATNLMGIPAEIYMYGTNLTFINLAFIVAPAFSNYFFLPIFFGNHFTSAYEYLEKRFGKLIRRILSAMFSIQMGLFTAVTLYAPALALSAVTDLSLWMSILSIGIVCTFYCTLGGMKAVLWTDVFQAFIMYTTLFVIIVVGCLNMGGLGNIFQMSYDGGRLLVPSFTFDFAKQYTMYNILAQGMLLILSTYGGSQIALQRLMSVKTLKKSRLVTYLSIPLCVSFHLLCTIAGLVVYSYFQACDPLTGPDKLIHSPDQLMPFFITNAMRHLPGLPGLCIAGIFSASLSTVSSAINSLAAVTYEDFVGPLLPCIKNPVICTKLLSLLYGSVCIGLSFLMANLGNLVKLTILIYGVFAGPNLAVFILGAGTTTCNEQGVAIGLVVSLAVGAYLNFVPDTVADPLLPVSDECPLAPKNASSTNATGITWTLDLNSTMLPTEMVGVDGEQFPVAYMWFSTIGMLTCLIIGYFGSMIINYLRGTTPDVPEIYLSPMRTWFFKTKQLDSKSKGEDSKHNDASHLARQITDVRFKNQHDTTL